MRFISIVLVLIALGGCATVEGIGEDVSAGARKVRNVF